MELQKEHQMSLLLITHDLGVIAQTAHRVAVMYAGRLVEIAHVEELFDNPRHPLYPWFIAFASEAWIAFEETTYAFDPGNSAQSRRYSSRVRLLRPVRLSR